MMSSTVLKPRLLRSAPYFPVADVAKSAAHYEAVFGFTPEYSAGAPPQFAILSRDGLAIMLRLVTDRAKICPNERQGGTWDAFFWVSDVEELFDDCVSRGAEVAYAPIIQDAYGMKECAFRDVDGYVLGFGQVLP
jgi:predicted enzyme related to lactoylglutathione lyase